VDRKTLISLLALTVMAVTSPTAIFARGSHHRTHGPYGPPYDGYRPYADSCLTVRYRVATPYGWRVTCRSDYWAWWQQ
jgi:hypothetical protein